MINKEDNLIMMMIYIVIWIDRIVERRERERRSTEIDPIGEEGRKMRG
jgi:hypothetical protein